MKMWFLTRSLYPYHKTGGGQIRLGQINCLEKLGWNINVIMLHSGIDKIKHIGNITQIPFKQNLKLTSILERIGVYEDYLDKWVRLAFEYVRQKISKEDIIFATSGGELGMIKLGDLLKSKIGCKFIINFHDPINYTIVNGRKLNNKFHVSREKKEKKYLEKSDLIITSSKVNQKSLANKYPELQTKIINNYFGFIDEANINNYKKNKAGKLRIAYIGNMGPSQKPEILYNAYQELDNKDNIEIYFIGNRKKYKPLMKLSGPNIKFIDFIPHKDFLKFMIQNIDVGFVSLANDYLGACVPSKIYEYINLGLPIIGALPDGDGKEIINNMNYGIACNYDDLGGIKKAIIAFTNKDFLNQKRDCIINDRNMWSTQERIKKLNILIEGVVSNH